MGFLYFPYSGLINSIAAFVVGFFILSKNFKSSVNRSYALFALSVTIWAFNYFVWLMSKDYTKALFFIRATMVGAILIPEAFLYFVTQFTGRKRIWIHIISICLMIIFISFSYSSIYIKRVEHRLFFPFWPVPGWLFHFMLAYFIVGLIYTHAILWKTWKQEEGAKKEQVKYVLFGIMTGFVGGCTNYFLWYNVPFPPYLNIFVSGFVVFVAYAIVRHQLLDIEIIIKKTLVFAGLLTSVLAIIILPTLLIQEYLLRSATTGAKITGLAISGIIIILTMRRIESFLINVTDKYLFQKKYDYKELLKTFTSEVLTVLELGNLVDLTVGKLSDIIKLDSAAVLLLDDEKQQFNVAASQNIKDPSVTLIRPDGIVTFMEATHGYILIKEMKQKKIDIPASIQEIIDKLNAELIIPMVMHEKVMGILSLGKKKSDEDYTQDDLDILLPLARTLAIAISNAKLFEELGKTQAEAAQKEKMAVIGTLAAGMAHEIRNPVTTIKIFSEYLPEKIHDYEFKQKYKNTVINEVDKIDHVIQTLIDFTIVEGSAHLDVISLIGAVEELLQSIWHDSKTFERIKFIRLLPRDLPKIIFNRKEFEEVLFNLTQNAIHAINGEGSITFEASEGKDIIKLSIIDSGCGMSDDILKNIFNPFFTTKSKGFGLGLFIVNELMRRNNSKIFVESKPGHGTTFNLEIKKQMCKSNKNNTCP